MLGGSLILGGSLLLLTLPAIAAVVAGLLGVCTGFFTIHAAAVGTVNRRLSSGQGRANALYVLFYYLGGWMGITCSGFAFDQGGWQAVIGFCASLLVVPLAAGLAERREKDRIQNPEPRTQDSEVRIQKPES